jgi:hypothetical protein
MPSMTADTICHSLKSVTSEAPSLLADGDFRRSCLSFFEEGFAA